MKSKLTYDVSVERNDARGSLATCKSAIVEVDTTLEGRADACNPVELLLGALGACIIKGITRVAPMIHFELRGVTVQLHAIRQDLPPRLERIEYVIAVDTHEPDARMELLHANVRKYGTVFNTVAAGTTLDGVLHRAPAGAERLAAAVAPAELPVP